jgi:8-oxo-dGTP pyrophosphatase MutT (NUDIX family)
VVALFDGRVCLITSSSGRRWVIPKGMIDPGQTPAEAALAEAWEEAGVRGDLIPEPVGWFTYVKADRPHHVTVFQLEVTEIYDEWPEGFLRVREWLPPELAAERVRERALREILYAFAE